MLPISDHSMSREAPQAPNREAPQAPNPVVAEELLAATKTRSLGGNLNVTPPAIVDDSIIEPETHTSSAIRKNGGFRLKNKMFHLTYSYHFDREKYLAFMKQLIEEKELTIVSYSIVLEFGKLKKNGKPHPHCHAAFKLSAPLILTNCRFFDYSETKETKEAQAHPNIRIIKACVWDYICGTYHRKEGGEVLTNYNPKERRMGFTEPTLEELQKCKTVYDVVELADKKGSITRSGPLIKAWEHCKKFQIVDPPSFTKLYPWQTFVERLCEYKMQDERSVFFVADPQGSVGKSKFAEHLSHKYSAITFTSINIKDCLHILKTKIDSTGIYPPIMIFDIPRSQKIKSLYPLVETLKSKNPSSGKYDSMNLNAPYHPIIFVFTNSLPDTKFLTEDRWGIYISNFNGESFDYTYLGEYAKRVIDCYIDIEKDKETLSKIVGKDYKMCLPFGQIMPINHYTSSCDFINNIGLRKSYWDRHLAPIIKIKLLPTGTETTIETTPMTQKEIDDYEKWKLGNSTSKALDHIKRLDVCRERVIKEYKESLGIK